jgi:precorrin-4/cobalt-precorrin-4 C11-methyltransferase
MKVYFVGAGPGDPELLTVKAQRLLREAKICIYAGSLVSPAVTGLVPDTAEKHDSAGLNHREVMDLVQDANQRDLDVVRLHTGDPAIYGAIGEQIEELETLGIDTEVVPGVSAFQASAAALKWELTVPEVTQSIVLTRTPGRTPMPGKQSLEKFAETGSSLCLFLSVHGIREHAGMLAAHYGKDCPAAVVYRASWPDEKIVRGTLADIGEKTVSAGITKTALFLVRPWKEGKRSHLYDPEFSHGCRGKGA